MIFQLKLLGLLGLILVQILVAAYKEATEPRVGTS
jgi:hypothetical protein